MLRELYLRIRIYIPRLINFHIYPSNLFYNSLEYNLFKTNFSYPLINHLHQYQKYEQDQKAHNL